MRQEQGDGSSAGHAEPTDESGRPGGDTAGGDTAGVTTAGADTPRGDTGGGDTGGGDYEREITAVFDQPGSETLVGRMGIKIVEASARRVVATMPVAGNTQPYGLLHGGASCVLAETIGSLASALHAGPDRITVGIEINATHHRAASAGFVTGVATMVHGGSTLTTYEIVITDERGRRICTARLTCLLMDAVPGLNLGATRATRPAARDV
jgi:1,4-dihydroxy-2-naphthoyl-CoA hydrolase